MLRGASFFDLCDCALRLRGDACATKSSRTTASAARSTGGWLVIELVVFLIFVLILVTIFVIVFCGGFAGRSRSAD